MQGEDVMNIAQALNERRLQLAISQQELAEHLGYRNRSSVSLLEKEEREWTFINVVKACELLELELTIKEKENV